MVNKMDQFENNTPVQGDTQGETSHNEPEQAPIQEAPVQETSVRETSAQKNGQKRPHDDVFAEQSFAETQYRQTSNGYAQNGYAQSGYAQNGYAQNVQAQNAQQPFDPYQQGVTTAMFPRAPMRQIRDSRVMNRRSGSMRSMPSRADMWLIPHRAGEFLPCRIYLRKR